MSVTEASSLVGLWEQTGKLHPSSGLPVPWAEGSLNASVREFFRFFEDGTFVFGRFLRDANVSFDDSKREFVCTGHTDKILHGRWRLKGNHLIEEFPMPDRPPEVRVVELSELGNDRFIVKEKTPLRDFVVQVVYRKVPRPETEPGPIIESHRGPSGPETDLQEIVATLVTVAKGLLSKGAFQPIGATISNERAFMVECTPPGESGMESRKQLHRLLVRKAKSGQVRTVAICHSLENQMGRFLVVCADHAQATPMTYLLRLAETPEGVQVSGEPIQQRAGYCFFKFVEAAAAQRLLVGRWSRESGGDDRPNEVTYQPDGKYQSTQGPGHWRVDDGDFFCNLVEMLQRGSGRERVSRIVGLSEPRLELHEVIGGIVVGSVYLRAKDPATGVGKRRPWWKFWTRGSGTPLDAPHRELVEVLRAARALLARPGNDFSWSSWKDAGTALRELDGHIAVIEAGSLPGRPDLAVLFAATGPIQEVSLSSGWADEFLAIAHRFDNVKQRVYA